MSILEVSFEDVMRLDDRDLTALLARLLEAETAGNGIPLSAIMHGGDGYASDEGVDAAVEWALGPHRTNFFLSRVNVFQCKAESMPPAKLERELRPRGEPRTFFRKLAIDGGAYVVFCGKDNCNTRMLESRVQAIKNAFSTQPGAARINLDFYDASRIARWCNIYPGVIMWLRDRVGRPLPGWRPYEQWSDPSAKQPLPYISDGTARAAFSTSEGAPEVGIEEALNRVRDLLSEGGKSVRIVGVSGTGKTRFAEALFEPDIGKAAIPTSIVIYADVGAGAENPVSVAEYAVSSGRRMVIIADNCPAEVHRHVTNVITKPESKVSFLSIDFDIGRDQPCGTQVVRLTEDSEEVIARLLEQREPDLADRDGYRIVRFSGGNTRIALALAHSSREGRSLADLDDRDLLRRLLQEGRSAADGDLMKCAEAASLVVSYAVKAQADGEQPEDHHLALLAGVSPEVMYRATRTFLDRGIGQQRGPWRAILPPALAARLARNALKSIPLDSLYNTFTQVSRRRIALSFAKRLGQLEDVPEASSLAQRFLMPHSPAGAIGPGDRWQLDMLQALAPAAKQEALDVVERTLDAGRNPDVLTDGSPQRYWLAQLLVHLAYDARLFERAARLLARLVKDESTDNNNNNVRTFFEQLFWIRLSGTMASTDQRMGMIDSLLADADKNNRLLGLDALASCLHFGPFTSTVDVTHFGGCTRSWGWSPNSFDEMEEYISNSLHRLTSSTVFDHPLADRARSAVARSLRCLCKSGLVHLAEEASHQIRAASFWPEGWSQICLSLHFDGHEMKADIRDRVSKLEKLLAPETLDERFEMYVLHPQHDLYTPQPKDENDHYINVIPQIEAISSELRASPAPLKSFVKRATQCRQGQAQAFGEGLVSSGVDVGSLFSLGIEAWEDVEHGEGNTQFLSGVLRRIYEVDPSAAEDLLDKVAAHETLASALVELSGVLKHLSSRSVLRIVDSLSTGRIDVNLLSQHAMFFCRPSLSESDFLPLLNELTKHGAGGNVAIIHLTVWHMKCDFSRFELLSPELMRLVKQAIGDDGVLRQDSAWDFSTISEFLFNVLAFTKDSALARSVAVNARRALIKKHSRRSSLSDVLQCLASTYPDIFFDEIVAYNELTCEEGCLILNNLDADDVTLKNPIDHVNINHLIRWTLGDPEHRAEHIGKLLTFCSARGRQGDELMWAERALELVNVPEIAPRILKLFERRFLSGTWTGSRASRYARRRSLCSSLRDHNNPEVRRWSRESASRLEDWISTAEDDERRKGQTFE